MPARAKLPPGEGKRAPLNMRTTQEIRARLEKAAADSGRSLVQEVETRLERSFLVEDHLAVLSGDPKTATFVREMLEAKRVIEAYQEKSAWDDFECHEAMKAALNRLLAQQAPKPSQNLEKRRATYERYKEKKLKPWRDRGGDELFNPDVESKPPLKLSPDDLARALGRTAADAVRQDRRKALAEALAEALRKGKPEEEG